MKRLLAGLVALFMAMFNNVDYQTVDRVVFDSEESYKVDLESSTPDYRAIYGLPSNEALSSAVSCRTTNFSKSPQYILDDTGNPIQQPITGRQAYWFVDGQAIKLSELENAGYCDSIKGKALKGFSDGDLIVAPYNADRVNMFTVAESTKPDVELNIEFSYIDANGDNKTAKFIVYIKDLDCIHCDLQRTLEQDVNGDSIVVHTYTDTGSAPYHSYSAGDVIGRATSETTIIISDNSDPDCSIEYFFSGEIK